MCAQNGFCTTGPGEWEDIKKNCSKFIPKNLNTELILLINTSYKMTSKSNLFLTFSNRKRSDGG